MNDTSPVSLPAGATVPAKVAIVALGPSSLRYIQQAAMHGSTKQYDEVWTVNSYVDVIRSDRLFHMDDFLVQERRAVKNQRIANMLEGIKRYKGPVITCRPLERYPSSVEFPLGPVIQEFGACYFANTVPYMLAYAGWLGVQELHLFGCDYSWPNRMQAEAGRACTEYWLGQLNARGIVTLVDSTSTLMDAQTYSGSVKPLYGYSDGHTVELVRVDDSRVKLTITPKAEADLPTAEAVEAKYDHGENLGPMEIDVIPTPAIG